MKTIIATLIAAALAVCATVWPPTTTADTTPTLEPPPTVAAETASVGPQAEEPAPRPEPTPQVKPVQPATTAEPEPTPAPQEKVITEEEELQPTTEAAQPIIEEPSAPAGTVEEPTITEPAKVDTETIIEHAKTGYEEEPPSEPPVVEPEPPAQTADISTVIAAAETFAIETYGVTIDSSLDFNNSAYRFPAAVPLTVDQDTLNNKAVDIVDYTFQQQMRRNDATIEKMREAGIRCKVHVVKNERDYQIYCLYA